MNRFSSPALAPASPEVEKRVSQKLMLKGITWGSVLLSAGWPATRVPLGEPQPLKIPDPAQASGI